MDQPTAPDTTTDESPVLEPKPPVDGSKPKKPKADKKKDDAEEDDSDTYHTIPGPRTETGKEQKVKIAPTNETSLSTALGSTAAAQAPQFTKVDFGKGGSLKIDGVVTPHNGVSGLEYDVVVRLSDTETYTLPSVPARLLK